MWRQAKATVGDKSADQALVNFADKTAVLPEWLEWPERPDLNAEVTIGDQKRYAGAIEAIGGRFHVQLMPSPIRPADPPSGDETAAEPASEEPAPIKKGTKK